MSGFTLHCYETIESTNDEARRLAEAGAPHGTVVTAREQTAGRGRLGRGWFSPPGNLYVSILLRLGLVLTRLPELGFVTALAVADTVQALAPCHVTLKWPNDTLVGDAKIAGVLLEQAASATVVGIGLNVRHTPAGTRYPATSLVQAGAHADIDAASARTVLLRCFACQLRRWQRDGFAPIRACWLARAHPPGALLRVSLPDATIEGRFVDIAADGALLLATGSNVRRIVAGDVAS
jgi:BirA family transcriptional regulator, biotin operon repressor / biotin---[acetyl-CoA-carboxylase] ligase